MLNSMVLKLPLAHIHCGVLGIFQQEGAGVLMLVLKHKSVPYGCAACGILPPESILLTIYNDAADAHW